MRSCTAAAVVLGALAGCYAPAPRIGAPCSSPEDCPTPQRCVLGNCSLHDAPPVDAAEPPDAAIDAAPPDAMRLACSTAGLTCSGTVTMFTCGGNCWVRCTGNTTRTAAHTACTSWQGALGEIDDATEQDCVASHLTAQSWLGLIQSDAAITPSTGWTWNGATPVVYTHWLTGKPDDADGIEDGMEQCASMELDATWDDQACNAPLDFFCERP